MSILLQIDLRDRRTGTTTRHCFDHRHGPTIRIGRDPTSELCLADPLVSSAHAVLELESHGARLRDLGSKNGIHLGGRRSLPDAAIVITRRLCVEIGPFHLEIVHRPGNDRQTAHGDLPSSPAPDLDVLHDHLARLHALHSSLTAARLAFDAALTDAARALAHDPAGTRHLLAEFPPPSHAPAPPDIHVPPDPAALRLTPPDLSQTPSALARPHLSRTPSTDLPDLATPPDLFQSPTDLAVPPHLSQTPPSNSDLSRKPPPPHPLGIATNTPGKPPPPPPPPSPLGIATNLAPATTALALIAPLARAVLPAAPAPADLDEARRLVDRVTRVLRDLAAGVAALQHLRIQQTRQFDLVAAGPANPLLTTTRGDDLLAHLLAWHSPDDSGAHELMDCFAVLAAHLRGHVHAALSTASHFAAHLAPAEVERRTRGPLAGLTRWRAYRERYEACVGDLRKPVLKDIFKNAYTAELASLGVHLVPRRSP